MIAPNTAIPISNAKSVMPGTMVVSEFDPALAVVAVGDTTGAEEEPPTGVSWVADGNGNDLGLYVISAEQLLLVAKVRMTVANTPVDTLFLNACVRLL